MKRTHLAGSKVASLLSLYYTRQLIYPPFPHAMQTPCPMQYPHNLEMWKRYDVTIYIYVNKGNFPTSTQHLFLEASLLRIQLDLFSKQSPDLGCIFQIFLEEKYAKFLSLRSARRYECISQVISNASILIFFFCSFQDNLISVCPSDWLPQSNASQVLTAATKKNINHIWKKLCSLKKIQKLQANEET